MGKISHLTIMFKGIGGGRETNALREKRDVRRQSDHNREKMTKSLWSES